MKKEKVTGVETTTSFPIITENDQEPTYTRSYDSGSVGWTLLGVFADPIWAFVVYLCWKDYKPRCAKKALIGAIIGLIIRIILIALIVVSFNDYVNSTLSDYQNLINNAVIVPLN